MNKFKIFFAFFIAIITSFSSTINAQKQLKKVVIDAGHGGKDPGAIGTISKEKDIALSVALLVRDMMKQQLPSVTTLMTRDSDFFVELKQRHAIANNANADLFISIHINSTAGTTTRVQSGTRTVGKGRSAKRVPVYKTIHNRATNTSGTETYVLGLTRTGQKEKAIGEFGDKITDEPGMLDESDPTTQIIISQYSQAFLDRSVTMASKIQKGFGNAGRNSLGVKQKSLEVLAGSAMPGVLIELGFINNASEEEYMNSREGQVALAQAIVTAIKEYKLETERKR